MKNQEEFNGFVKLKATSVHEGFELIEAVGNFNSNPHENKKDKF